MSPFVRLGVSADADEAQIRRAYAKLLRITRPDDDPVAFQALNDAYRECLSIAAHKTHAQAPRHETVREDESRRESPQPPPTEPSRPAPTASTRADGTRHDPAPRPRAPAPPVPPARPRAGHAAPQADERAAWARNQFDLDAFLHELFARTATERPIDLLHWLRDLAPLYALELKHALRLPIARALTKADPPPPSDAIDAIAEFFDLVTTDPREARLHHALESAYRRSERNSHFQRIIAQRSSRHSRPVERWLMHELLGPRSWLRRVFIALIPMLPTRLMELLDRLEDTDASLARSQLDAASVGFWRNATDRKRLNYRRMLIALARCTVYYLLTVGLASLLMALDPAPFAQFGRNVAALFAAWLIAVALWAGMMHLKERLQRRWGWDLAVILASAALLTCLVVGYIAPVETAFFAGVTTVVLILVRGRIHSVPAVAFYIASLTALCAFAALLGRLTDAMLPYIAVAAGALQIAHDVIYARSQQITVAQARGRSGWLWYLSGATAVAAIVMLFAGVSG